MMEKTIVMNKNANKKMKANNLCNKILTLIIVLLCFSIFTACSTTEDGHTHSYVLKNNAYFHWLECNCGNIEKQSEHNFTDGDCNCGAISPHTHDYTMLESDSSKHWYECSCGAKKDETLHNYSTLKNDSSKHWYECSCGAKQNEVNHVEENEKCKICNFVFVATDGILYDYSSDKTYAEVIGYSGTETNIRIASTYQGVPIKSIYNAAFKNSNITSAVIPNSVTSIGKEAFYDCYSLTSVTIGDSVTSIGEQAFYSCDSLTSVEIPNSVISIGEDAFRDCNSALYTTENNLKYVKSNGNNYYVLIEATNKNFSTYSINSNTKYIACGVFNNCERLSTITIPDSVTSIGDNAFFGCDSLTSVVIGDSVTSIGDYAFYYCNSLTSVTIGDSVTSIGEQAFYSCDSLTSVNYTGTIDSWAQIEFNNYSSNPLYYAKNLYINNELVTEANITTATKINAYTFYNCDSLTSVTIGDSVTSIGDYAFDYCNSLTSITFSDTSTWYRTTSSSNCYNKTGGTQTSVTNSSTNATYFKSTYEDYYWYKL